MTIIAPVAELALILMIHDDRAWLVRGDWNRTVNRAEFRAWAAYTGVELRRIEDSRSKLVVLATKQEEAVRGDVAEIVTSADWCAP